MGPLRQSTPWVRSGAKASAGEASTREAPRAKASLEGVGGDERGRAGGARGNGREHDADDADEAGRGGLEGLTPRKVEVLRLLSRGQTNPQIAQNLMISRGTAKIHVQHILSKLGVSDRTRAAVRAIEAGMVTSSDID